MFIRNPITRSGKSIFKPLNYYGSKTVMPDHPSDTIYFSCQPARAISQSEELLDSTFFHTNICLYSFMDAHDMVVTPKVLAQLYPCMDKIKHLKAFKFISINLQSDAQRLQDIKDLANKVHADEKKWVFANVKGMSIKDFINKNFWLFNDSSKADMNEIAHTIFLVDKEQHVRGIYDATYVTDVKRMCDEAVVLESEYRFRKKKQN
jgi:protein SCO1/2